MQQTKAGILQTEHQQNVQVSLFSLFFFRFSSWGFCVRFLKVEQQGN
jgi:hypothetical protein